MIVEYTYSEWDLRKQCHQCHWLEMKDNFFGECKCPFNKVKDRQRCVTDRACSSKNAIAKIEK
jgi:hypothetical protein